MKAIAIKAFGNGENAHLTEVPNLSPAADEVLIKVAYAGVNPVDWKICEGYLQKMLPHQFPLIPGWDASGTIVSVGEEAKGFKVGDEVYAYCRKPAVQWGTYAEYVTFEAKHIAHKPKNLTLREAAALPLVGLTAWQSLFEAAKLTKGETILIHAGAGGVGSLALQFAKHAGAKIYTTASSRNHDYVKQLGAQVAIDYTKEDFAKAILEREPEGVDCVYDCVGYKTLEKSYELVKKEGTIVSIVNRIDEEKCKQFEITGAFVFVRPDGVQLKKIADLIEAGSVKTPPIEEFPITDFAQAWGKMKLGHTRGKIVLKL